MTPLLEPNVPPAAPSRPSGLTAWLVILLLFNAVGVVAFFVVGSAINGLGASDAKSTFFSYAPSALALVNVACLAALFKNKKWGFWGLCATTVLWVPITAVLGAGIGGVGFGVVGAACVGVLYALLQVGTPETKTWPRLH